MHTITFAREFRHPLPGHRVAVYPPGIEIEVSNDVFSAAQRAGVVFTKDREVTNVERSAS